MSLGPFEIPLGGEGEEAAAAVPAPGDPQYIDHVEEALARIAEQYKEKVVAS